MKVQNKKTLKFYEIPTEEFNSFNQETKNLFTIVSKSDTKEVNQTVTKKADEKLSTGSKTNDSKTKSE